MGFYIRCFLVFNVLMASSTFSYSQLQKGSFLIGGTATYTDYSKFFNYTRTEVEVAPNIGYFLFDKFALGLRSGFTIINSEYHSQDQTTYLLSPYLRYYILSPDRPFNIMVQTHYQNQFSKSYNSNEFGVSGGLIVFLSDNIALEFLLGYTKQKSYNENINSLNINSFKSGISFQIHLNR